MAYYGPFVSAFLKVLGRNDLVSLPSPPQSPLTQYHRSVGFLFYTWLWFLKLDYIGQSRNVRYSLFVPFLLLFSPNFHPVMCENAKEQLSLTTHGGGRFLKFLNDVLLNVPSGKTNPFPKMADEHDRTWPRVWNSFIAYYLSFKWNTRTIRQPKRATVHEKELDWAQKGYLLSAWWPKIANEPILLASLRWRMRFENIQQEEVIMQGYQQLWRDLHT